MKTQESFNACLPVGVRMLALLAVLGPAAATVRAADLLSSQALDRLAVQRFWSGDVPIPADQHVTRAVLLDDNLYLLTNQNLVFTVHARTGVLRWTARVAEPGQTVRGPTHSRAFVFFTTSGSVKVLNRRTGELAGEPRKLRGFIIDVAHDIATISIGRVHGVRADDILRIVRTDEAGLEAEEAIAQLRVTVVKQRRSKGRIIRPSRTVKVHSGLGVSADVVLPLRSVTLPFAASSPAVADDKNLFVGAANERLYSLDYLTGVENWRIMTPRTISTAPILRGENLYFAGHDGRVVSCTRADREKNWIFETEGPIFADLVVGPERVYAVSTDRLLYCLDREKGHWIWRKRFDNAPVEGPRVVGGRVYQQIPNEGLFVLDAETGEQRWHRPEGGRCLTQLGRDVYLLGGRGAKVLLRVDAATGTERARAPIGRADFVEAGRADGLILLATKRGALVCLRSKHAPRLRPSEVAEVLREDRRARASSRTVASAGAGRRPEPEAEVRRVAKPRFDFLEEEDWLTSRSRVRPTGTRGLIETAEGPRPTEGRRVADEDDEGLDEDEGDADDESLDEDDEGLDEEEDESEEDDIDDDEGDDEEDSEDDEDEDSEDDEDEDDSEGDDDSEEDDDDEEDED